jgi:hypothetical protein
MYGREERIMGFFDKFKKGKEDKLDKQIAELQKKQQEMPQEKQQAMQKEAADYLAKMNAADIGETHKSGTVSAADTMDAAKVFDSLAGSLGIKTDMTRTALRQTDFGTPDVIKVKAGQGNRANNNFVYGVDNDYAPVYYCVETEKAYAPGWRGLIDMVIDTDMFETNGGDSDGTPAVMSTQAGTAANGDYTMVYGVAKNYAPVIYCNELKKYVHFTWDDISRYAIDEGIESEE